MYYASLILYMDSDDEDPDPAPPPPWLTLEWRRGPWPRPLPEQASLLEPALAWARTYLAARRPAARQMHMGEAMAFYWSTELGGYVERGKEDEYRAKLAKVAPPPKAVVTIMPVSPLTSSAPPPVRARGRQYVDAHGQRIIPTGAPLVHAVAPLPVHVPVCTAAPKVSVPGTVLHAPCLARPFSLSMDIELETYPWDAALAEFERSIHWLDEWI